MPTLPQSAIDLSAGVQTQSQPSLTWRINKDTRRIEGTCDGYDAVRQAVEIILNIERFRWQIYRPYTGVELQHLIGRDPGYAAAELQRRVREALMMDDRVRGVSDYRYSFSGNSLSASLTVNTVYGDVETKAEVNLT